MTASPPPRALKPLRTPARPRAFPQWAAGVLLLPLAACYLQELNATQLIQLLRKSPPLYLAAGGLLLAIALGAMIHWGRGLILSLRRPYEPWLWDRAWRRTLVDQQVGRLLSALLGVPFVVTILALLHFILVFFLYTSEQIELLPTLFFVGFVLLCDVCFIKFLLIPFTLQVLGLLRFGQMRLRLPQVPLPLGSRSRIHLVARSSLARLSEVKVELRQVREWRETSGSGKNRQTILVQRTDYTRVQHLEATALREGRDLPIELELPSAKPSNSTVLHGKQRCRWELTLSSDVPGVDLDTTFLLPVYYVAGENPSGAT